MILIHTSNLTGLQDDYSKRTMNVLVGVIGVIVLGAVSAMAKGPVKASPLRLFLHAFDVPRVVHVDLKSQTVALRHGTAKTLLGPS